MKKFVYTIGRFFQLAGLIALPSAIWVSQFRRDERGAIAIFAGSVAVFFLGAALSRIAIKG